MPVESISVLLHPSLFWIPASFCCIVFQYCSAFFMNITRGVVHEIYEVGERGDPEPGLHPLAVREPSVDVRLRAPSMSGPSH